MVQNELTHPTKLGNIEISNNDGIPLVSRHAVYPPELYLPDHTVLSPENSLERISSSELPPSSRLLLTRLIEKGRVLDWKHLGIGYALDYSRILNRQLNIEVCDSLASDQIQLLIDEGVNCILAPDSSGGPIAAFYGMKYREATNNNPLFVRLHKGTSLTMDQPIGVQLASYTRTEGSKPLLSTITAEVGDFPTDQPILAALIEDVFDTGAIGAAVSIITQQLRKHGVDIQLISAVAPFSKTYAGNGLVLDQMGIRHIHTTVEIEGLVPMNVTTRGMIQVAGISEILTLARTDVNGHIN